MGKGKVYRQREKREHSRNWSTEGAEKWHGIMHPVKGVELVQGRK